MSLKWKAACAAAVISAAVPAQAADFLIYRFAIEGRGSAVANQPNGTIIGREGTVSDDVVFYLPATSLGRSSFGWRYVSPDPFPPHGGTATVTDGAFDLSVQSATVRGYENRSIRMTACGDFGGTFQATAVAIDPGCSTFESFHGLPRGLYGGEGRSIRGVVTGMTITEGFGTPYQFGYVSGPEFYLPEPATWALLVVGIGAVGGTLRRRPRVAATV